MKKLIFIVLGLLLLSCNKDKYYKKEIIGGDWVYFQELPKPFIEDDGDTLIKLVRFAKPKSHYINTCYSFLNDEKYEDRRGFYNIVKGNCFDDTRSYYLGNESKYEIKGDSLRLYDLADKKWSSFGIIDLKLDTLSLSSTLGDTLRFKRKRYVLKNKANFDKIIISSSGCYGICPMSSVLIDKSGDIIFEGLAYTTINGLYKSKITKAKFDKIIKSFQKADWLNLKDRYEIGATDHQTVSVSFVKNNKVIKTISDYGGAAPDEFMWAYASLTALYQQLKLVKLEEKGNGANLNINLLREQRNYPYPKLK